MVFASPLWLLGLLPWAAAVIWLLLGRRERIAVPFVSLWRGPTQAPTAKPFLARPPLAVVLAILSLLLAVLASARPQIVARGGPEISIVVDCGITMFARGAHAERFKETCDQLSQHLLAEAPDGPVRLICIPTGVQRDLDRKTWNAAVATLPATLQNSLPVLDLTVRRVLAEGQENVIVVSDQPVAPDARVLQIEPERPASNLTIANVAARSMPHAQMRAQVMVQLRDQNCTVDVRRALIRVESAGHVATQNLLIPRNGSATAFIDLPALGPVVSIDAASDAEAPDDLGADNHAELAQEQQSAIVEDSPTLPEALRRMIAVYNRHRAGSGSRIAIFTDPVDLPADQPAIVLAPDSPDRLSSTPPPSTPTVEPHPLTANVDWNVLAADARGGTAPAGWHVLVSKGAAPLLALRGGPAPTPAQTPAVWVCLNSPRFPLQPDYVIFWTNVFDWLGGKTVYRWHPLDGHEKPGIQTQRDGSLHAFNAINVDFPPIHQNDWGRLRELKHSTAAAIDLTPVSCLAALVLMVMTMVLMGLPASPIR